MPSKLWWWVKPLFLTGWFVFLVFAIAAIIASAKSNSYWLPAILAAIAIAPWVVCIIATAAWFFGNMFAFIWRR